ncbi:hypothetical protein [Robertkochia aurantiaca]|uniref:hypothetical protein n=1 Tax=Robertkochia aurantiaca TaxID=2873700 RepID=UPI001CCA5B7C|nr:hypothetical protein [Robertkochia sp. 3YJGBD-33]
MNKSLLFLAFTLALSMSLHSQKNLNISVRASHAVGISSEVFKLGIDSDISYHSFVLENLMLGGSVGYGHIFVESLDRYPGELFEDYNYVPILASVKVYAADLFFLAVQPGYAITFQDYRDNGFIFRAKAGYNLSPSLDVVASYQEISQLRLPTVGLGLNFYL